MKLLVEINSVDVDRVSNEISSSWTEMLRKDCLASVLVLVHNGFEDLIMSKIYRIGVEIAALIGNPMIQMDVIYAQICGYQINRNDFSNTLLIEDVPCPKPFLADCLYDNVVLGGAFDHLHSGHKMLLSKACQLAKKRVIVGVSMLQEEELKKKKYSEYIQPLEERLMAVKSFIQIFKKGLKMHVVGISDAFGPTRTDPDIQAIVGSTETEIGCGKVNDLRKENGLSILDIRIIDCLGLSLDISQKVSSTTIREFLSATRAATNTPLVAVLK